MERQFNRQHGAVSRSFCIGEAVFVKNYGFPAKPAWAPGTVTERLGEVMYRVRCGSHIWVRHANQLQRRVEQIPLPVRLDLDDQTELREDEGQERYDTPDTASLDLNRRTNARVSESEREDVNQASHPNEDKAEQLSPAEHDDVFTTPPSQHASTSGSRTAEAGGSTPVVANPRRSGRRTKPPERLGDWRS